MRQIGWDEVRTGDVVRVGGQEFTVRAVAQGMEGGLTLSNEDGHAAGYVSPSVLKFLSAVLHRPSPPLPQEVGEIVRVGGTEFMRVFTDPEARESKRSAWVIRKGYRPGEWIRSSWLQKQDFEVLSEGVEVPE